MEQSHYNFNYTTGQTPMYGFKSVTDQAKINQQETVNNLNFDTLKSKEEHHNGPSIGLSMNTLIDKEDESAKSKMKAKETDNSEVISAPKFSSLIKEASPEPAENAFAVQMLPTGVTRSMLPKPMSLTEQAIANAHLNKSDATQKSSGKKINNWFSRMIEQRGEDYLTSGRLSVDEVSKNVERIIDDMIAGRVDYNVYGKYIIQPVIIETLINYCSNKLAINKAIQYSLGYTYNDYVNKPYITDPDRSLALASIDDGLGRDITQSITIVNQDILIYEILYKKLMYVNSTKNASSLYSLTNDLNNYKKQSKKRY